MKPLDGIKVLDLTMWAFCPAAAAVLAGWGADVIHIENAANPDPMRSFAGGSVEPGGSSWMFNHYNRGKRSIAINLVEEAGREVLRRLVVDADVFLTSFLPATRQKLGFDVDDLRAINPNLIYAKGTGAGPLGPEAHRGGYDGASYWNRGSLATTGMSLTEADWPLAPVGHGDGTSGLVLAGGISTALLQRERTGRAPVVDSSLLGTAIWVNAPAIISSKLSLDQQIFSRPHRRSSIQWSSGTYRTSDNRFINLCLLGDFQNEFVDFCQHVGRPELVDDARFADTASRIANSEALTAIVDEVFATTTYGEWCQILLTLRGVWAPVQNADEIFTDAQALANGMVAEAEYPAGPMSFIAPPIMFDQTPSSPARAPDFGEHTDEILIAAGFTIDQISELREVGAVA
ncbi:CaiB/BaiF CoA transferase family protein [Jatrophihabitans sp. DSM 45814]